jgi:secreted trypsin-like serine protease
MMRVPVLFAGLLVLLGVVCRPPSAARAEDTEMIVAGTEAPEGKYPYQVCLYSSMADNMGFCGGSIIASQWVLTAAHCLSEGDDHKGPNTAKRPADVVVGYGSNDRKKTKKIAAAKIIVRQGHGDVALIKLQKPIADPKAITLANPDTDRKYLVPGAKVTITGWGALWDAYDEDVKALMADLDDKQEMIEKWQAPVRLREVELDAMNNETCNKVFEPSQITVAPTEVCAMYQGTKKAQCNGDSCGPIVVAADAPRGLIQIGVVSWSVKCASTGTPSVFARVSSFTDRVQETMKNN